MRLIDADAIVHYQSYDDEHEGFPEHESTIAGLLDMMTDEGCPDAVDAVPVRCKDCKWYQPDADEYCGYFECMGFEPDDYCSCGERKDGDHHDD